MHAESPTLFLAAPCGKQHHCTCKFQVMSPELERSAALQACVAGVSPLHVNGIYNFRSRTNRRPMLLNSQQRWAKQQRADLVVQSRSWYVQQGVRLLRGHLVGWWGRLVAIRKHTGTLHWSTPLSVTVLKSRTSSSRSLYSLGHHSSRMASSSSVTSWPHSMHVVFLLKLMTTRCATHCAVSSIHSD